MASGVEVHFIDESNFVMYGKGFIVKDDADNLDCEVDSLITLEWNDSLDEISDFEGNSCPARTAILKVSFQVYQALCTITATTVNLVQDLWHQERWKKETQSKKQTEGREY